MELQAKQARIRHCQTLCREHGMAMTVQRHTIFRAILDRNDHPSADKIYESVREQLPSLSRTTIYRVLETFVRVGALTKVCHPGAAVRYDARITQHHHLVCLHCNKIVDVDAERMDPIELPGISRKGFEIQEYHVHFRGTCPSCRKKGATEALTSGGRKKTKRKSATRKKKARTSDKRRRKS